MTPLLEDNHIIAINKKSGDIVQGDKTGDITLLEKVKSYVKIKYNKPGAVFIGCVHRLDRPTSGIVLYARTSKALTRLNQLFQDKKIQKTYWAVVTQKSRSKEGVLVHYLQKNQQQNKSYVSLTEKKGFKRSELNYRLLSSKNGLHLLEITPKTGRHHQIRVQLSQIGCIINGDLKYGAKSANKDASIHLHARKIEFIHPVKKEPISIIAPLPKNEIWNLFA